MHISFLRSLVLASMCLLVLSPVHAQIQAGFAPGPVWLSKGTALHGDNVQVYTVVYNSSATPLEGSVRFLVDDISIGSTPFSLEAGSSGIKSITWKAVQGTHTFRAEVTSAIEKQSKQVKTLASATTTNVTITVAGAAPTPIAVETLQTLAGVTASASPAVAEITNTIYKTTESIRKAGQTLLEHQLPATTTPILTKQAPASSTGSVLGAETYNGEEAAREAEARSAKPSWLQIVARALLPIFSYPAIFYPVFFILIVVILWIVAKRLRNPQQRNRMRGR